jgi:hypothetical protein
VGVVAIGDAPDGVAQDLDGRLGKVLVVVRRAGLAKVLEFPGVIHPGLDIFPWLDAGQSAKLLEACVWSCSSAQENRFAGRTFSGMMLLRCACTT